MPKPRHRQPARRATKKPVPHARPKKAQAAGRGAAPARRAPVPPTGKVRTSGPAKRVLPTAAKARPLPVKPVPVPAPGPSSHDLAVESFERGFQALQQRQFGRAAELLKRVVRDFPDEKEMQERARVYLSICERQAAGLDRRPRSFEERLNAATVAVNRGAFDEGLALLRKLEGENPESDHVQYLLSVTNTAVGEVAKALSHLRRAIELNPENRLLSVQDADLEALRRDAGFAPLAQAPLPRRRSARTR